MTAWQRLFRPQGGDFITDESERGRLRGPLEGGDHRPPVIPSGLNPIGHQQAPQLCGTRFPTLASS